MVHFNQLFLIATVAVLKFSLVSSIEVQCRYGHSSVYLPAADKLVIYGGQVGPDRFQATTSNTALTLDLNGNFDYLESHWNQPDLVLDTSKQNISPFLTYHSAVPAQDKDGKEAMLVLFGINNDLNQSSNSVYQFSIENSDFDTGNTFTWKLLNTNGAPSPRYEAATTVIKDGRVFTFGGVDGFGQNVGSGELTPTDSAWILDLNSLTWIEIRGTRPSARWHHTATATGNSEKVFILGGTTNNIDLVSMSEIWIYDVASNTFELKYATGEVPLSRRKFTSVSVGNSIYIFGGTDRVYSQYYNEVYSLNIKTLVWTRLTNSTVDMPIGRYAHGSALIGTQWVHTFGYAQSTEDPYNGYPDDKVFALDVLTASWKYSFDIQMKSFLPPDSTFDGANPKHKNQNDESSSPVGVIVGTTLGASVFAALTALMVIRKRRLRQATTDKDAMIDMEPIRQLEEHRDAGFRNSLGTRTSYQNGRPSFSGSQKQSQPTSSHFPGNQNISNVIPAARISEDEYVSSIQNSPVIRHSSIVITHPQQIISATGVASAAEGNNSQQIARSTLINNVPQNDLTPVYMLPVSVPYMHQVSTAENMNFVNEIHQSSMYASPRAEQQASAVDVQEEPYEEEDTIILQSQIVDPYQAVYTEETNRLPSLSPYQESGRTNPYSRPN